MQAEGLVHQQEMSFSVTQNHPKVIGATISHWKEKGSKVWREEVMDIS